MKISKELSKMSKRAAQVETNVATARQEGKEKLDARIQQAKTKSAAHRDEFKGRVESADKKAKSQWQSLANSFNERKAKADQEFDSMKASVNRTIAQDRALLLEDEAMITVGFALMAIEEAEAATIMAIDARIYAGSLAS